MPSFNAVRCASLSSLVAQIKYSFYIIADNNQPEYVQMLVPKQSRSTVVPSNIRTFGTSLESVDTPTRNNNSWKRQYQTVMGPLGLAILAKI